MRDQVLNVYRGIEEYNLILFKLAPTFKGLYIDLRTAISQTIRIKKTISFFKEKH